MADHEKSVKEEIDKTPEDGSIIGKILIEEEESEPDYINMSQLLDLFSINAVIEEKRRFNPGFFEHLPEEDKKNLDEIWEREFTSKLPPPPPEPGEGEEPSEPPMEEERDVEKILELNDAKSAAYGKIIEYLDDYCKNRNSNNVQVFKSNFTLVDVIWYPDYKHNMYEVNPDHWKALLDNGVVDIDNAETLRVDSTVIKKYEMAPTFQRVVDKLISEFPDVVKDPENDVKPE